MVIHSTTMADHFDEPLDAALIFDASTPSSLFDLIDEAQIDTPPLIGGSGAATIEDGVPQLTYPPFFGVGDETITDTNYQSAQQPQPLLQNNSEVGPFGGSMIAPPPQARTGINPFNGLEGSPVADGTMMAPVSQDLTIYADSDGVGDETIADTNYQSVQQPQPLLQNTSEVGPSGGSMVALPLQAPTRIDPFNALEGALADHGTMVAPPLQASTIYANSYDDSRAVDMTSGSVMVAPSSQVQADCTNSSGDIGGVMATSTMVNPPHHIQTNYTKINSFIALEGALVADGTMVAPPPHISNYANSYGDSRAIDMTSGAAVAPRCQVPTDRTNSFGDIGVVSAGTMVIPPHQVQTSYTRINSFNAFKGNQVANGTIVAPPSQILSNYVNSYGDSRAIDMTSGAMVAPLCQVPINRTNSFGDIGGVVTTSTMMTLPQQVQTSYSRINPFNASEGALMANGTMVEPPPQILSTIYENSYGDSRAFNMTSGAMVAPPYRVPIGCNNSFRGIGGVVAAGKILETSPRQVQTSYTNVFNSFDGGAIAGGTIFAPPCLDPTSYTHLFKASEDAPVADGAMVAPRPVAPTRIAPFVTSSDATMVEHSAIPILVGPISATPSTPSMVGPAQPSSAALAEPSPASTTKPLPTTLSRDYSDGGDMMIIPVVEPEEARLGRGQPQRNNSIKASSSQRPSLTTNPNGWRVEAELPSSGLTVVKRKERPLASSSGHDRGGRQGSEWRAEEKKAKRVISEIIEDGKDIPSSLLEIVRKHQRPIFVESAQGVLGNVYVQCDGNHWITSLSGPLLILSMEGCFYSGSKASNLRVTLSRDGRIYKGLVKGRLTAASSVTVSYIFG